jgi:class 3 adenylate cyclase
LDAVKDVKAGDGGHFSLRIGIDCGPIVAGVIGRQKIAYDLWGDTVNIASRLEATSRAGHIHVSRRFQGIIKDEFEFVSCGKVALKGKGEIESFFLIGRKSTTDLRKKRASPSGN